MTLPANLALFPFPGYGPEVSRGLVVRTQRGRVILTEAASNPGTSVRNAIEAAVPMALRSIGLHPDYTDVFLWTPRDPIAGEALWRVDLSGDEPAWSSVDWRKDEDLRSGVNALIDARGTREDQ
jgi:hypothetical protein